MKHQNRLLYSLMKLKIKPNLSRHRRWQSLQHQLFSIIWKRTRYRMKLSKKRWPKDNWSLDPYKRKPMKEISRCQGIWFDIVYEHFQHFLLNCLGIFRPKTGPREYEIHKFNNTILSGTDLEIFTYYWKIEQFSVKLKSNISTLTSPMFSIAGLNLQVKASFNHLGRDYLNLQIEQLDDGTEKSNIILKAGDMFKKIQSRISFNHKIAILDQVRKFLIFFLTLFFKFSNILKFLILVFR